MTREEFIKLYESGIRDFFGKDLQNLDLSNLSITDVNFASIKGYNLNLANSNITRSIIDDAYLQNANMQGCIMTDVSMIATVFSGANITNAKMSDEQKAYALQNGAIITEYYY